METLPGCMIRYREIVGLDDPRSRIGGEDVVDASIHCAVGIPSSSAGIMTSGGCVGFWSRS